MISKYKDVTLLKKCLWLLLLLSGAASFSTSRYSIWQSQYLTGNLGGLRSELQQKGITLNATYENNVLGNITGGLKQGLAYTDSIGIDANFNLQTLLHLVGSSFYISLVDRNGSNLSAVDIGNQFTAAQLYGGQTWRLNSLYFEQQFDYAKILMRLGRLNAGDTFLQSDLYCNFVNNAFCGNPVAVFLNVPFSAYPNAQWGYYLQLKPSPIILGKMAIYNTNTSVNRNRYHGFHFSFHGNNGVMLITEWALLNNQHLCWLSCHLPGKYTVGMMYFSGRNQIRFQDSQSVQGNYGYYVEAQQKLYSPQQDKTGLSTFFVVEFFPSDRNLMPFFFNLGLIYQGLIPERPQDKFALGFVRGNYSDDLASAQLRLNNPTQSAESFVEINYRIQVNPWLFIQPDIQYIMNPRGFHTIKNAWVVGEQMGINI